MLGEIDTINFVHKSAGIYQKEWLQSWKLSNIILMQFTGLHDKNKKRIFEGDIVFYGNKKHGSKEVVFYDEKHCKMMTKIIEGSYRRETDVWVLGHRENNTSEIIGNIHSNPDLLKGAKHEHRHTP